MPSSRLLALAALAALAGCAADMRPPGTPAAAVSYTGAGYRGGSGYAVAINIDAAGQGTVALDSDCRGGATIAPGSVVREGAQLSLRAFGCSGSTIGVDLVNVRLEAGLIAAGQLFFLERRDGNLTRIGKPMLLGPR